MGKSGLARTCSASCLKIRKMWTFQNFLVGNKLVDQADRFEATHFVALLKVLALGFRLVVAAAAFLLVVAVAFILERAIKTVVQ